MEIHDYKTRQCYFLNFSSRVYHNLKQNFPVNGFVLETLIAVAVLFRLPMPKMSFHSKRTLSLLKWECYIRHYYSLSTPIAMPPSAMPMALPLSSSSGKCWANMPIPATEEKELPMPCMLRATINTEYDSPKANTGKQNICIFIFFIFRPHIMGRKIIICVAFFLQILPNLHFITPFSKF